MLVVHAILLQPGDDMTFLIKRNEDQEPIRLICVRFESFASNVYFMSPVALTTRNKYTHVAFCIACSLLYYF